MLALLMPFAVLLPGGARLPGPSSLRLPPLALKEPVDISEGHQLELIRSYASASFTAVVSGALIGGLSQAANLDFVSPAALACALYIWAFGVTTGFATWGAAYHAAVALATLDHENDMRWRRMTADPFHASLTMFLLGLGTIGISLLG